MGRIYNVIMKKYVFLTILIIGLVFFTGCGNKNKDAVKFKEDYEQFNDKETPSGKKYRKVSIDEKNPFVYTTGSDIVKRIEKKETFYVYFGDAKCPWCRSAIEKFIKVAKENKIDKVYYVNIWDDDYNEILRDKYELDDDNKPKKVSDGDKSYQKLLEYFDEFLSDYNLTNDDETISVGEKRIYAPNFIYVYKGEAKALTTGNSDKQKDPYEKLTDEILEDEEDMFKDFFKKGKTCYEKGC